MSRTKRLPKGLQEFEGSLYEMKYALELLPRLLDLPENGLSEMVRRHAEACTVAKKAEEAAEFARKAAALAADDVWKAALKNWTVKELQEATGYTDE